MGISDPQSNRFQRLYIRLATGTFNFFVLFVVFNVLIGVGFKLVDNLQRAAALAQTKAQGRPAMTQVRDTWQLTHVDTDAFSPMPPAQVTQLLDDMARLTQQGTFYQPWVQFSNQPFHTATVNVDEDDPEFPHRRSIPQVMPAPHDRRPAVDVYTFGGSTMFGFNATDADTLASALWNSLQHKYPQYRIRVTNYGRLLYYSTQETTLLNRLLRAGRRPQAVVFLDGLNDTLFLATGRDQPNLTTRIQDLLVREQHNRDQGVRDYNWVPMVQLAYVIKSRLAHTEGLAHPVMPTAEQAANQSDFILKTYRLNVQEARRTAAAYGATGYFFFQPVPLYHYNLSLSRTPPAYGQAMADLYQQVYASMALDPATIFLGDALKEYGADRKVFVDDVHYGPDFTRFLAEKMTSSITLHR